MSYLAAISHKAEMEGYQAGLYAKGVGSCPYATNSVEWFAWIAGYRAGYSR
jgi:ribosome modulation factor